MKIVGIVCALSLSFNACAMNQSGPHQGGDKFAEAVRIAREHVKALEALQKQEAEVAAQVRDQAAPKVEVQETWSIWSALGCTIPLAVILASDDDVVFQEVPDTEKHSGAPVQVSIAAPRIVSVEPQPVVATAQEAKNQNIGGVVSATLIDWWQALAE